MKISRNKSRIVFSCHESMYPLEAILSTCYVFLDRFYIHLDKDKKRVLVSLRPKNGFLDGMKTEKDKFLNELLSNSLRYCIARKNRKIRESIIQEALFFSRPRFNKSPLLR